jgi:hypothetical protein
MLEKVALMNITRDPINIFAPSSDIDLLINSQSVVEADASWVEAYAFP